MSQNFFVTKFHALEVVLKDKTVTLEAVITEMDDDARSIRADGLLMVNGFVVYKLTDFTMRVK
ncbi:MAG: hypothetical protein GY846_11370 [Deltaproteobacteria bacterium]|nr:hypothetical protein [Deltaproteobacteria bacterium]